MRVLLLSHILGAGVSPLLIAAVYPPTTTELEAGSNLQHTGNYHDKIVHDSIPQGTTTNGSGSISIPNSNSSPFLDALSTLPACRLCRLTEVEYSTLLSVLYKELITDFSHG